MEIIENNLLGIIFIFVKKIRYNLYKKKFKSLC
jgi:hypothetical protein